MSEELLDYCRIKKIFKKGFGFLSSLHYEQNVFFHFSKIKDEKARNKLEKLKRGEIYVYFTSEVKNDKRRVKRLWLDLNEVNNALIPKFIEKIIEEFTMGKTNPFELGYVVRQLLNLKLMDKDNLLRVISTPRIYKMPSAISSFAETRELREQIEEIVDKLECKEITDEAFLKIIIPLFFPE